MSDRVDPVTGEVAIRVLVMAPALAAAIVAVKKGVKQLGYDEVNKFAGYKYVSVDKFYDSICPLMAAAGLFVVLDEVRAEVHQHGAAAKDSSWLHADYQLYLCHESGAMFGPLNRSIMVPASGLQAFGSAQSYLEKQFLRALFKIPTGEKDEVDSLNKADLPQGGARKAAGARNAPPTSDGAAGSTASHEPQDDAKAAARIVFERLRKAIQEAETPEAIEAVLQATPADWEDLKAVAPEGYNRLTIGATKRIEALMAKGDAP